MKNFDMAEQQNAYYRRFEYVKDSRGDATPANPPMSQVALDRIEAYHKQQDKAQESLKAVVEPREIKGQMCLPVQGMDGYPEIYPVEIAGDFPLITWEQWEEFNE